MKGEYVQAGIMAQSLASENRILSALLEVNKVIKSLFELEKNLSKTTRVPGDFLEMERGYKMKKYGLEENRP